MTAIPSDVPARAAPPAALGEPHLHILPRSAAEAERARRALQAPADFTAAEPFERRPAGAATRFDGLPQGRFSLPSANMDPSREMDFQLGKALFEKLWVGAPSATKASDGLGPLYNARGCASCHIRDGRGHPPEAAGEIGTSMVLRLSVPDAASDLSPAALEHLPNAPEPVYGLQLQDRSLSGIAAEGRARVDYDEMPVDLGDGSVVTLRRPFYSIENPGYGPLHPDLRLSPRIAPQMIGLGLLEAIPEADILALADPDDSDGDGISGRPNRSWSAEHGQWMLGRFGWKAGQPVLAQQAADAFAHDIGISTPLYPDHWGDCTQAETACRAAPEGGAGNAEGLEIPSLGLDLVTHYIRNLAVPARRDTDAPQVLQGKRLFHDAGCAACHVPKQVTHRLADRPGQSFQLIWPYTDLLLHDMGAGLADGAREWRATGREWRTPPLWGLGLTAQVSGHSFLLHDGRARSLTEAVLWHGGEAAAARENFRQMPSDDRDALIAFLESL